jgi:hypothetical protein
MYGQFLPSGGQEVLWDSFLHRRLLEGAITVEPVEPVEPEAEQAEKEPS